MNKILHLLILTSLVGMAAVGDILGENIDVGRGLPVRNYPVGFIYVEYPQISDNQTGQGNNAPCIGNEVDDLKGTWVKIEQFDGNFLRSEGAGAKEFDAVNFNLLQTQATQKHTHDHAHPHTHEVPNHSHGEHNHEHEHNDVGIVYSEGAAGTFNSHQTIHNDGHNGTGQGEQNSRTDAVDLIDIIHKIDEGRFSILDVITYFYEPDDTPSEENSDEVKPRNYVVRIWQKIEESIGCTLASYVYEDKYEEILTNIRDKQGKFIKTETTKKLLSRKPKLDKDGSYLLRRIEI